MNERSLSVLEQYDLVCRDTFHARSSFICRTDKGRKLLYPFQGSNERAALLYSLQSMRKESGEWFVDLPVPTAEGTFVSEDMYGNRFMLKDWIETDECDVNDEHQLKEAATALGRFHKGFRLKESIEDFEKFSGCGEDFCDAVKRHNREITKVFRYIRNKNNKTEFEFSFQRVFDSFLAQCKEVLTELESGDYRKLHRQAMENACFSHGDFSHHDALIKDGKACVVHPEHFKCEHQIEDLAHFMRKVLEKNDWDVFIGEDILTAYDKEKPLTEDERSFLKLRLTYPEKFWKLANHYYNSKKSWIMVRQEDKLNKLIEQDRKKQLFIKNVL